MKLSDIPRRSYTSGATPLEFLPRLTQLLGGPNIYIKRDDQLGLTAGGNKTRKLEYLMSDAVQHSADTVVTMGGLQSNHCRLTLSAAVTEGMKCHLVLIEYVPGSYRADASGNNLLYRLLGADQLTVVSAHADAAQEMDRIAAEVKSAGGTPYVIVGGGSSPLGTLGYLSCAEEILAQARDMGVNFSDLVCATGSGGTQAGLTVGLAAGHSDTSVTGISVGAPKDAQEEKVFALATETASLAGGDILIARDQVKVLDQYVGPGYSLPTPDMVSAVRMFARTEGILLDPVYTGKAAAGLIDMVRQGAFEKNSNVLFLHTGGTPAIYTSATTLIEGE